MNRDQTMKLILDFAELSVHAAELRMAYYTVKRSYGGAEGCGAQLAIEADKADERARQCYLELNKILG